MMVNNGTPSNPMGMLQQLTKLLDPKIVPPAVIPFLVYFVSIPVWVPAIFVLCFLAGRALDQLLTDEVKEKLINGIKGLSWQGSWRWMIERIQSVFNRLFGERHWSVRCIVASAGMTLLSLVIFWIAYAHAVRSTEAAASTTEVRSWTARAMIFASWVVIALIIDYLNLWKIRAFLNYLVTRGGGILLSIALGVLDFITCLLLYFVIGGLVALVPLVTWALFGVPDIAAPLANLKGQLGIDFAAEPLRATLLYLYYTLELHAPLTNFRFDKENVGAPFLYAIYVPSVWIAATLIAMTLAKLQIVAAWYLKLMVGFKGLETAPCTTLGTNFGFVLAVVAGLMWWWFR